MDLPALAKNRRVIAVELQGHASHVESDRDEVPLGVRHADHQLVVEDPLFQTRPVDMDLSVLLGKPPKMTRHAAHRERLLPALNLSRVKLAEAALRVLRFPAVASKTFLISIGDRTVGGLCSRDPFVGPWQVPVADVAVTLMGFNTFRGEAMAMGERTPLALISPRASGRMAVGEAIMNIAAARIDAAGAGSSQRDAASPFSRCRLVVGAASPSLATACQMPIRRNWNVSKSTGKAWLSAQTR
jgi:phosphoribosylformylglycinamidine synthase